MPSHTSTHIKSHSLLMFRAEVALLLTIVSAGAWMGLPGCSSTVAQPAKTSNVVPGNASGNPTGEFGTEAAFRHLVERTDKMDARPLQSTTGPRVSDQFPDVVLTSHRNEALHFRSDLVRDRIVCIAMFYTRCTGTCPGTISKVLALRRSLSEEFGPENLHFVCITLDPDHDDVRQLRTFADQLGVVDSPELARIHLCTGDHQDIDAIRRAVGMYDLDPEIDSDRSQHAAMIVTGNDRYNRWAASPAGLKITDLHETALRIAGESERQRFSARFASDSGFSLTALRKTDGDSKKTTHACCELTQSGKAAACCSDTTKAAEGN